MLPVSSKGGVLMALQGMEGSMIAVVVVASSATVQRKSVVVNNVRYDNIVLCVEGVYNDVWIA